MAEARSILVIDDEEAICRAFERFFTRRNWQVRLASSGGQGLSQLDQAPAGVVFCDVRLPDANGLEVLQSIRRRHPNLPVVIITAYGNMETVMTAMERGAADYLVKPIDLDRALELAERFARPAGKQPDGGDPNRPADARAGQIVGTSRAMQQLFKRLALAARSQASVLITGQTGTGKELVARAIHQHSSRARAPFVAVNCGALPDTLAESELFGCVRGAFTGADVDRPGRFESADGGTLFLDEVAELTPPAQVKLLRVLDSGTLERLGSTQSIRVDVRILAATNRDLPARVEAGEFREDLYYRLAVIQLHLPPLRQRDGDVPALAAHFRALLAGPDQGISNEAMALLERFDWPGNVRQLQNVIQQAAALAGPGPILPEHLPAEIRTPSDGLGPARRTETLLGHVDFQAGQAWRQAIEPVERAVLREALRRTGGQKNAAAEILGLHRNTLRNKLRQYDLD
jgi:DNA-binding NtrC family response regulator